MSSFRIVTDPATGKMRTADGPAAPQAEIDLEKARRECRDVIAGNVQFHNDPYIAQKTTLPFPTQTPSFRLRVDEQDFYDQMLDRWCGVLFSK